MFFAPVRATGQARVVASPTVARMLYSAGSLYEANLILDLLREVLIRAEVRNENLVGLVGLLPESATLPTIWITNEGDFERARAVVDQYEARRSEKPPPDIACPQCGEMNPGNFELCWKCRSELPAAKR
jgi:hypothetical protein